VLGCRGFVCVSYYSILSLAPARKGVLLVEADGDIIVAGGHASVRSIAALAPGYPDPAMLAVCTIQIRWLIGCAWLSRTQYCPVLV